MPSLDTSLATVAYSDTGGPGPVVLLLHAALHDRADYESVDTALAAERRVVALDWPGHGQSPSPAAPLGAPEMGHLAIEFVDLLDLKEVVVVGNSVGGYAACRLALERPGRVAGVVLVNTGGFNPHTPFIRAFCAAMGRPAVVKAVLPGFVRAYMRATTPADEAIVARVLARGKTADGARTAAALWRSFTHPDHDLRQRATDISVPTLITWGAKDVTAPVKLGLRRPRCHPRRPAQRTSHRPCRVRVCTERVATAGIAVHRLGPPRRSPRGPRLMRLTI